MFYPTYEYNYKEHDHEHYESVSDTAFITSSQTHSWIARALQRLPHTAAVYRTELRDDRD